MLKMNRLTAYDSSDRPMITWKVRGRSTSQTPERGRARRWRARSRLPSAAPSAAAISAAPRGLRRAHRLVGQRGEDQQRRADHHGEHADVEEQRAGQVDVAEQRQRRYARCGWSGTDSRTPARPAPVTSASSRPTRDPAQRAQAACCASTHCVPATMYCSDERRSPSPARRRSRRPARCGRAGTGRPTTSAGIGSSRRTSTAGTIR